MRTTFQQELDSIQETLELQSGLVLRSIRGATESLVSLDVELADEVIAFDDEIDEVFVEIERGAELLIATQTPVATDLRLVLAVLLSASHLERQGDLCTTIAKLTKLTPASSHDEILLDGFREMGARADEMTRVAVRSLVTRDDALARSLQDLDELIDRANRRVVGRLLEIGGTNMEYGLRMVVVSRCLERIGDHAVDIGEQTHFLVTGEFSEFTDSSRATD